MNPQNQPQKPVTPMPFVEATLKQEQLPTQRIRPLYRGAQVVWYILAVIEVLLGVRFLLRLLAANPTAGFTKFIYGVSGVFAGPFLAVFRASRAQGNVFEWSTLLAMAVYALIAYLIVKAIVMSKPVSTMEADSKLNAQE